MRRWVALEVALALVASPAVGAGTAAATTPVADAGYLPVGDDGEQALLHYEYALPDADDHGDGPYPTLVLYSGYGTSVGGWAPVLRREGYATISVTVRGSGCSGGTWELFSSRQVADGLDVLEWVGDQPWSADDAIALVGESYGAIMGLLVAGAAGERRAAGDDVPLHAVVAAHPLSDLYRDVLHPGGIPNIGIPAAFTAAQNGYSTYDTTGSMDPTCAAHVAERAGSVPNQTPVFAASRPWDDPDYRERSPIETIASVDVPVFTVVSWQDETLGARPVELLSRLDVPYEAVVGNGHHQLFYAAMSRAITFLDRHLRSAEPSSVAPVTVWWEARTAPPPKFATPSWTTELEAWPPPQAKVRELSLSAGGRLVPGPGEGDPDLYVTNGPGQSQAEGSPVAGFGPVPRLGRNVWPLRPAPGTALPYTTDPFERDLTVLGEASVDLWLSSTAPDTDVQVTVTEVRPDGGEVFVQHGWLRASHRALDADKSTRTRPYHPHTSETALTRGVAEELRIEILPFGHVFRAGSRLRLWIESPKTTPDGFAFAPSPFAAVNRIHHDVTHPSRLVLSVLPSNRRVPAAPACDQPAIRQPCR